jgi:histidinol-phosphate aminotransferase
MRPLVEPHVAKMIPYIPGKPIEETEREYGVTNIAKLASNENCMGPSPKAVAAVREAASQMHLYPDAGCFYLKGRLCERHAAHDVRPEHLAVANGTNEILTLMVRAFLAPDEALLNAWPSFVVYKLAAMAHGRTEVSVPLDDKLGYDTDALIAAAQKSERPIKLIFIANPNNPTGRYLNQDALESFVERLPAETIVVLDEAYAEYVTAADYPDGLALAMRRPRTIVTRTFSKAFGLAAARVGYAVGDPEITDALNRMRDPFNVNSLAQAAALAALDDTEHIERSVAHNTRELPRLAEGLTKLGVEVTPSVANFVLATFPEAGPALDVINEESLKRGVILRPVAPYGLPRSARITVGTTDENERLLSVLGEVLGDSPGGAQGEASS